MGIVMEMDLGDGRNTGRSNTGNTLVTLVPR